MNDHDALLAAVLANPGDDLPRLVLADWLEESGQPALVARAHFIRAQVEAASLPEGSPDRAACEEKAADLYRDYGAGWNATLPEWTTWSDTLFRYHRGFVAELITTPRRLFRDAHELAAVAPVTQLQVRTTNTPNTLMHYAKDWPWFERVWTLWIGPRLALPEPPGGADPFRLTTFHHLTGLRRLSLAENSLNDDWIVRFAAQLPRTAFSATLAELDLSRNRITDAGAHTLATARGLDQLHTLDLRANRITESGLTLLRRRFGERLEV
jgi:uncharacterized protein (TIGR02996 family)